MSNAPDTELALTIPEFVGYCDVFMKKHGKPEGWLSKQLFNDTYRLAALRRDKTTDMGVRRLERAFRELKALDVQMTKPAS